jgi:hypothetical protein
MRRTFLWRAPSPGSHVGREGRGHASALLTDRRGRLCLCLCHQAHLDTHTHTHTHTHKRLPMPRPAPYLQVMHVFRTLLRNPETLLIKTILIYNYTIGSVDSYEFACFGKSRHGATLSNLDLDVQQAELLYEGE